jgi:hypothetical protein
LQDRSPRRNEYCKSKDAFNDPPSSVECRVLADAEDLAMESDPEIAARSSSRSRHAELNEQLR